MAGIRKTSTTLKFLKPSSWWGAMWREGLPLGNGITGANVYGGALAETVMLSSALSLWQGNIGVLPDISDKLKSLRKLLDDGKYTEAEKLYPDALINKNYRPTPAVPLPVCDFKINTDIKKPIKEYNRLLNMENGEATVSYKEGNTKYQRSMFVSRAKDLIIMEIKKSGSDSITANFSFDLHDKKCAMTSDGIYTKLPQAITTKYEPHFMYFSARKDNGMDFGAVARITYYGGSSKINTDSITVKGANNILIIIKLFTESQREREWKNLKTSLVQNKLNYDKMLKEHSHIHSKLFKTAELNLNSENNELCCEELLQNSYNDNLNNALLEKLWSFGRYLAISCCNDEGNLLANPYGLWCGDYKGIYSYPEFNGKTQNFYRIMFENNLCDLVLPLFNYFENCINDLKKNAQRLYNCKGYFIPAVTAPETGLLGSCNAKDVYFIGAAADIACMFYEYYCYTKDKKFLKTRAMPFMKEVAVFYEDFLKLGDDGFYTIYPSYLPENCPSNLYQKENGFTINVAKNSEMDFAVIEQLLKNLLNGSDECGLYKDEKTKWKDMLTKIPKTKISSSSFVYQYNTAEYAENFDIGNGYSLYKAYPFGSVNDIETKKAYINSVKRRIAEGGSTLKCHTISYLAMVCSRLFDTDTTIELINRIIKSCVMDNMVTADNDWRNMGYTDNFDWASYQMYGNTMLCGAITSIFAFSDENNIFVLPCKKQFLSGNIKGLLTKCGCELNINWDKKSINLNIKAKNNCKINICLPAYCKKITKGPVTVFDENKIINNVELLSGKVVSFVIKT